MMYSISEACFLVQGAGKARRNVNITVTCIRILDVGESFFRQFAIDRNTFRAPMIQQCTAAVFFVLPFEGRYCWALAVVH